MHPNTRLPGGYTEAAWEPAQAVNRANHDLGPGSHSPKGLHPQREPLLGALREVPASKHPEREKLVLKPTILKDWRRTRNMDKAARGPGSYKWSDSGPQISFVEKGQAQMAALHGATSPLSMLREASKPKVPGQAFPAPLSLGRLGLSQEEAQAMRTRLMKRKTGWALETATGREPYHVRGSRNSFVASGGSPCVTEAPNGRASVDMPCRPGAGPGSLTDGNEKQKKAAESKNARRTVFSSNLGGRDAANYFARTKGDIAVGAAATSSDPNIGPGYVDPVPFTEEQPLRKMKMLKCRSMSECAEKEALLRTRMKLSNEIGAERRRQLASVDRATQETWERRERMNWAQSQRQERAQRKPRSLSSIR